MKTNDTVYYSNMSQDSKFIFIVYKEDMSTVYSCAFIDLIFQKDMSNCTNYSFAKTAKILHIDLMSNIQGDMNTVGIYV